MFAWCATARCCSTTSASMRVPVNWLQCSAPTVRASRHCLVQLRATSRFLLVRWKSTAAASPTTHRVTWREFAPCCRNRSPSHSPSPCVKSLRWAAGLGSTTTMTHASLPRCNEWTSSRSPIAPIKPCRWANRHESQWLACSHKTRPSSCSTSQPPCSTSVSKNAFSRSPAHSLTKAAQLWRSCTT